jgi:hypothetical protein
MQGSLTDSMILQRASLSAPMQRQAGIAGPGNTRGSRRRFASATKVTKVMKVTRISGIGLLALVIFVTLVTFVTSS